MIIVMCATKNWYIYLATEIYALLQTNKVKKIYLFIEDDNIPYIQYKNVEFINANKLNNYIYNNSPNYNTKYTKMSFVRCYLSKVLKEDKILYIDSDAIVNDDISDLWNINIDLIAGVHEGGEWDKYLGLNGFDDTYINTGLLLMNLKQIREEKLDDKMLELLNTNKYYMPDQDVINIVCKDRITYLPVIYNSTETTGFVDNAKIIHYIRQRKGWIKTSPRSEIWFKWFNKYINSMEVKEMKNFEVKVIRRFDDLQEGVKRQIGDIFKCTKERFEYLKANNAVELVSIEKVEEKSNTEIAEEIAPKKTTRRRTKKEANND